MTAHWMLYSAAVGLLLVPGALALEGALRACGRPVRWAWLAALLATLALPAAARLLPREAPPAPAVRVAVPAGERVRPADLPARRSVPSGPDLAVLDRPLRLAWGAGSLAVLLALLGMAAVLRRRRARWRPAEVAGVPVLLSRDAGPAVVGVVRSRIVLPEWAAAAEPGARDLMLAHELEHLRAGDPRLLAVGLAALALMPWNPAVWWQLRRLRLGVEIDCDARVLRRGGDVRAYGSLLLEVGRRATGTRLAAAALTEPHSFLERRIRIMTLPRQRFSGLRAAGLGTLALGLAAAACEMPAPTGAAPVPVERVYSAADAPPGLKAAELTPREAIARYFPDVLTKGTGGNGQAIFVLDHTGRLVRSALGTIEALTAPRITIEGGRIPGPEVAPAPAPAGRPRFRATSAEEIGVAPDAIESVEVIRFRAGQMGPDPVDVIWIRLRDPAAPPQGTIARARTPAPAGSELVLSPGESRVRTAPGAEGRDYSLVVEPARDPASTAPAAEVEATDPATIAAAVQRHHPEVAAGRATSDHLWFVVSPDGEVVRTGNDRDPALGEYDPATIHAVEVFKGDGVRVNGRSVSVIWVRLRA